MNQQILTGLTCGKPIPYDGYISQQADNSVYYLYQADPSQRIRSENREGSEVLHWM